MSPTTSVFGLLCLIIIFPGGQSASPSTLTVCRNSSFTIYCPRAVSSINIQSVFYGRNDSTTCTPALTTVTNCVLPSAVGFVKDLCDGKSSCTLHTTNDFFVTNPCSGTTKYLILTYECLPECTPPCATCLDDPDSCTSCVAGYYLASDDKCTQCTTCGQFQYDEGGCCGDEDRRCTDCVSPCETCSDATTCSACESGFYLDLSSNTCEGCTICGPEQYESTACSRSTNRGCTDCTPPCATCSSPTTCESCIEGYYLDSGNMCRACRNCTATQYEIKACSNANDRQCSDTYGQRCADQTFYNRNKRQCIPWLCSLPRNVIGKNKYLCDSWRCSQYISYRQRFSQRCARVLGSNRL